MFRITTEPNSNVSSYIWWFNLLRFLQRLCTFLLINKHTLNKLKTTNQLYVVFVFWTKYSQYCYRQQIRSLPLPPRPHDTHQHLQKSATAISRKGTTQHKQQSLVLMPLSLITVSNSVPDNSLPDNSLLRVLFQFTVESLPCWKTFSLHCDESTLPYCEITLPGCENTLPWCEITLPWCRITLPCCEITPSKYEMTLFTYQLTPDKSSLFSPAEKLRLVESTSTIVKAFSITFSLGDFYLSLSPPSATM